MKKNGNGRIFVSMSEAQMKQFQDEWIKRVLFETKKKGKKVYNIKPNK